MTTRMNTPSLAAPVREERPLSSPHTAIMVGMRLGGSGVGVGQAYDGNQVDKRTAEANLFKYFLTLCPDFAGGKVASWHQPTDDPPDVICHTASGDVVAVELSNWLDESQISRRKPRQQMEQLINTALGEVPENWTQNFHSVWMHPCQRIDRASFRPEPFRRQLFDWITELDTAGVRETRVSVPSKYDAVSHVLEYIEIFTIRDQGGRLEYYWISFPAHASWYTPETMVNVLQRRLSDKCNRYRENEKLKAFAQRVLLIHYDQALIYNTPVETPHFKFHHAADAARTFLNRDAGVFDRVYLMISLEPSGKVFQLYP